MFTFHYCSYAQFIVLKVSCEQHYFMIMYLLILLAKNECSADYSRDLVESTLLVAVPPWLALYNLRPKFLLLSIPADVLMLRVVLRTTPIART